MSKVPPLGVDDAEISMLDLSPRDILMCLLEGVPNRVEIPGTYPFIFSYELGDEGELLSLDYKSYEDPDEGEYIGVSIDDNGHEVFRYLDEEEISNDITSNSIMQILQALKRILWKHPEIEINRQRVESLLEKYDNRASDLLKAMDALPLRRDESHVVRVLTEHLKQLMSAASADIDIPEPEMGWQSDAAQLQARIIDQIQFAHRHEMPFTQESWRGFRTQLMSARRAIPEIEVEFCEQALRLRLVVSTPFMVSHSTTLPSLPTAEPDQIQSHSLTSLEGNQLIIKGEPTKVAQEKLILLSEKSDQIQISRTLEIGNKRFHLCQKMRSSSPTDANTPSVWVFVEHQGVIYFRYATRSQSTCKWRVLAGGNIDGKTNKAEDYGYEVGTSVHHELEMALEELPCTSFYEEMYDEREENSDNDTYKLETILDYPAPGLEHLDGYPNSYLMHDPETLAEKVSTPEDFIPDFSKPPLANYFIAGELAPGMQVFVYQHHYRGIDFIISMALEGEQAWVHRIAYDVSNTTTYGTQLHVLELGPYATKAFEYDDKLSFAHQGYIGGRHGHHYKDCRAFHQHLPLVKAFKASRTK